MRFMVMHKVGQRYDAAESVEQLMKTDAMQREVAQMGAFIQQAIKEGVFTNGAGLLPKQPRTRVVVRDGHVEVQRDARGQNNLVAGFAQLKVAGLDDAIEWAKRFAAINPDEPLELGLVTEAWHLGFAPKPEGKVPERYLLLFMASAASESGAPPSARAMKEVPALMAEMVERGVLEFIEGVMPSKLGARMKFKAGQRVSTVDGPFAESKELIAGFSVVNVPSREAALAWAEKYGAILQDLEVDVLKLHDEPALDSAKR